MEQAIPDSIPSPSQARRASVEADDIDNLKRIADAQLVEIASGDIVAQIQNDELNNIGERRGSYYRDIIFALVQIRLPEEEARRDWRSILDHKYTMSEKLGRNVGIHVATLDFYTNIKKRMRHPKIIDAFEYVNTARHAILDELTRAYNRRFFREEFGRLFYLSRAGGAIFSLVLLDMDHFKQYNDINGHIKGDIVLMETVRVLHAVCSPEDTVARYGGEEFVVLLPGQNSLMARQTAEHLRAAIYDYRYVNEQRQPGRRLSASFGVTTYRDDMKNPTAMLEEADVALYRAKNNGRNCVKVFLREDAAA
jgi:diguanylate cyclase (GGDEF)-like protein